MRIIAYVRALNAIARLYYIKLFGNLEQIKFSYINHFGRCVSLNFDRGATVILGKGIGLRDNVCVTCRNGGKLTLGDNVFFNNGCQIVVHNSIIVEKNVKVGPYTCFYDHDYDYDSPGGVTDKVFKTKPIVIGEGTWIGAGCIILRGTTVGKNCVIAAGSIVKGTIQDNSLFIKK